MGFERGRRDSCEAVTGKMPALLEAGMLPMTRVPLQGAAGMVGPVGTVRRPGPAPILTGVPYFAGNRALIGTMS